MTPIKLQIFIITIFFIKESILRLLKGSHSWILGWFGKSLFSRDRVNTLLEIGKVNGEGRVVEIKVKLGLPVYPFRSPFEISDLFVSLKEILTSKR